VRVLCTARSVFLFFVCFLNERQKANEDAFTGPFPYEEGVFEEKNKPTTTKTFSSRTTDKKRTSSLPSSVARAWVLLVSRAKFGWLSPLFFVFFVFKRERKGKEYDEERTKLNRLLPFLIP